MKEILLKLFELRNLGLSVRIDLNEEHGFDITVCNPDNLNFQKQFIGFGEWGFLRPQDIFGSITRIKEYFL